MNKILMFFIGMAGAVLIPSRSAGSETASEDADTTPQYAWVRYLSLDKNFVSAGSPTSYLKYVDKSTLYMCGYWDTVRVFDTRGYSHISVRGDSNIVMYQNGVWKSEGKISLKSDYSIVYFRGILNGIPYITTIQNDSVGTLASNIWKLNTATNRFEPVTEITFDSGVRGFMSLGNNKVFIWGVFFQAKDIHGVKEFNGAAIWNMDDNTLTQIPNPEVTTGQCACGLRGISGNMFDMSPTDTTLVVVLGNQGGARMYILRNGINGWANSLYPDIPIGGIFVAVNVISKDRMFAIWQKKDSIGEPCYLMSLRNNQWQSLGRFTIDQATYLTYDRDYGIEHINGKLYISGPFASFNGDSIGHTFIYDTLTRIVTYLPKEPFINGWPKIKLLNGKPCVYDRSSVLFPLIMHALRDTFTSITLTGPATTRSEVTLTGSVTGPKDSLVIYQQMTGSPIVTTYWLQADNNAQFSLPPLKLQPGTYMFYGTTTNGDKWTSSLKILHTMTVEVVTAVGDPSPPGGIPGQNSGIHALCYPNPAHSSIWLSANVISVHIYSTDGRDCGTREFSYSAQDHEIGIFNLSSGMYIFICEMRNRKRTTVKVLIQR